MTGKMKNLFHLGFLKKCSIFPQHITTLVRKHLPGDEGLRLALGDKGG